MKSVPVMTTGVPLSTDPTAGVTLPTRAMGTYRNSPAPPASVDGPKSTPLVLTCTDAAVVVALGGASHRTSVGDTNVAGTSAWAPDPAHRNWHRRRGVRTKPVPVTTSGVPPATGPDRGATCATTGATAYSNSTSLSAKSCPFTLTCTVAMPAAPMAGVTHATDEEDTHSAGTVTEKPSSASLPAGVKRQASCNDGTTLVAVTIVRVPPSTGPRGGDTPDGTMASVKKYSTLLLQ